MGIYWGGRGFGVHMLASLFFAGQHKLVAQQTVDSPNPQFSINDFSYVVGALVLLGRIDEAETLYLLREKQLTPAQKTACRFFLGTGLCRASLYERSRAYFIKNIKSRRENEDSISRFYLHQGLGFYYYFAGSIKKALRAAEKSFTYSLDAGFLYGRAFAADLKGHSLVQTGEVSRGLKTLELGEHLASQLGAEWLKETIQSSSMTYRLRFGISGTQGVSLVLKKIKSLSKQDTYTQSALLIELSQEYLRKGRLTEAKDCLNDCCALVYASQNRRQAAMLNLRYAYIHYLEGEPHLALNLIRNALTQIDRAVDVLLELRLRGFEKKLVNLLKIAVCEVALEKEVAKLTSRVGEAVALRMLARQTPPGKAPLRLGEDIVGDLWDLLQRDPAGSVEAILKSGYWGMLAEVLPVSRGQRALYLELEPGSLTIFDSGNVEHFPEAISRSLKAVLLEIQKGPRTKQDLISTIWKYEYHPLRHDQLIYSAVAKLRKILGRRSHWVEASEQGYQLRGDIKVLAHREQETPVSELVAKEATPIGIGLNHRQHQILRLLRQSEFIDTATCCTLFETSEVTASRDLNELLKLQFIDRIGRGRATKYRKKAFEINQTQ